MSSSSPSDLAVTFRSVPRRLREAIGDAPAQVTGPATAELDDQISASAALLRTRAEPAAIAEAIEAIPADDWNEETLDALRSRALDIGRLLRAIAAIADGDD